MTAVVRVQQPEVPRTEELRTEQPDTLSSSDPETMEIRGKGES